MNNIILDKKNNQVNEEKIKSNRKSFITTSVNKIFARI